ncbi:MAG: methyltransferase [Thermoplasmata archaeon]|nr:MAG: methyltransferase [Thermoplasmata archaeon]
MVHIDDSIKITIFDSVYEPAEDSYLLIEAIDLKDLKNCKKALDMGCGTGIIALHLAKYCPVVAADVNEMAVKNTMHNAKLNGIELEVRKSDLFSSINEKFDIITFNPPYLPTEGEDIAWNGGKGGIDVMNKFFEDAWKYLNRDGKIYFIASSLSNIEELIERHGRYEFKKLKEKAYFFEKLYAYVAKPVP